MKSMQLILLFAIYCSVPSIAKPVQVTPAEFGDAKQPQLAVSSKGGIFLVFGNSKGIWFSSSIDGGETFTASKKIDEVKGLALGMRRGPRIAVNDRKVTITAISHDTGNLHFWHSTDAGATWSTEAVINEVPTSAREGMHGLAADGNGNVFVVWLDLREKKTQLWGSKSSDGGKTWQKNIRIYKSPDETICECCHPTAAFGPKGEIIAMWRNWLGGSRDLFRSISTDGGATFGEAVKLGTGSWPLKGCPMDGGSLAIDAKEIVYVWRRESKIFATTADVPERLINETGAQPITVPSVIGGFDIFWQDSGNLYRKHLPVAEGFRKGRRFDEEPATSGGSLFAKNAAYVSAVWEPKDKAAFVVWEGATDSKTTSVFFERVQQP